MLTPQTILRVPELETPRLRMRGFESADVDAYAAIVANPRVMRYIGNGEPLAFDAAWANLASLLGHWALRGYGLWAVVEKRTGQLVGRVGFHNPQGWPGLELGWLLAEEHWGCGYATEAAGAALRYGEDSLGAADLISLIQPENVRSIRVAERLGARQREELMFRGNRVLIYAFAQPC